MMNLKDFSKLATKELASKIKPPKTPKVGAGIKGKKKVKGPGSLLKKREPTTPEGM